MALVADSGWSARRPDQESFWLSSLARSSAPRLVVPDTALLSAAIRCICSAVSTLSLALIDRLMERVLRSTLMTIVSTSSPSFRQVAGVFDTVAGQLGGAQIALDVVAQVDDGATRLDALDDALDDTALLVDTGVVVEGVAFHLLDAQRDALTLGRC